MLPIHTTFGALMILFGLIGGLRGWAKEIIVACSVVVALFFQHVLLNFVPQLGRLFGDLAPQTQFYTRAIVFIVITIFGYASPTVISRIGAKVARERLQDILLGFFIGLLNGFLIVGTVLAFLDMAYFGVPREQQLWQQVVGDDGQPVRDEQGNLVEEFIGYTPDAEGIGGIEPPEPDTTSSNLLAILPPRIVEQSNAALYLAVALSFVFVLIVFI
jgi:uncharacterized membrane protein required for colicin V production